MKSSNTESLKVLNTMDAQRPPILISEPIVALNMTPITSLETSLELKQILDSDNVWPKKDMSSCHGYTGQWLDFLPNNTI